MKTIRLDEILTKEQLKKTLVIINQGGGHPLDIATIKALKAYYKTIEDDLLAKDIPPDYLAYQVAYQAQIKVR
jgi:hypothetical protein